MYGFNNTSVSKHTYEVGENHDISESEATDSHSVVHLYSTVFYWKRQGSELM